MKLFNLFSRRPAFSRSATRYSCQIDGSLIMIDRMASFDGRMIDFSAGGAMFRPKLVYLMDRRDVPVCLDVGGVEVFGRIASTNPAGFGIRFDEPLDDEDIAKLLRVDKSKGETRDKAINAAEADVELF